MPRLIQTVTGEGGEGVSGMLNGGGGVEGEGEELR